MQQEQAEIMALKILSYLAEDGAALTAFLRLSGLTPDSLVQSAASPETLAHILDFILQDEKRLVHFCSLNNIDPSEPGRARKLLPGSEYLTHG